MSSATLLRVNQLSARVAALAMAALLAGCAGDDSSPQLPSDLSRMQVEAAVLKLDKLIPELMQRSQVPGAAVGIVFRGEPIYARGFGVRSLDQGGAVDADTVFQLASMSKPVGATVVARQVGEGLLNWETPMAGLLPGFELSDPQSNAQLTVADLYSHRSGLRDHAGDQLEDLGYNRAQVLHQLRYAPVKPLGTSYAYTNFGLTAAAQGVAHAAGQPWEVLSERALYQPLGMTRTSSRYQDFVARDNHAVLHALEGGQFRVRFNRDADAQSPAGGVSSSVNDVMRWLTLLQGKGMYHGQRLVAEDALMQATTRHAPEGVGYGYGFNVGPDPWGYPTWSHSGAFLMGGATNFIVWPDSALSVVVLTNGAPVGLAESVSMSLGDMVRHGELSNDWYGYFNERIMPMYKPLGKWAGQEPPASPTPALPLDRYVGQYTNDYYGTASITLRDGALQLALGADGKVVHTLRHWDGNDFVFDLYGENAPEGSVSALTFDMDGNNPLAMDIEYYGEDLTQGHFTRLP